MHHVTTVTVFVTSWVPTAACHRIALSRLLNTTWVTKAHFYQKSTQHSKKSQHISVTLPFGPSLITPHGLHAVQVHYHMAQHGAELNVEMFT